MAIDRGNLDEQLRAIGEGERWWEQPEFRDLPYILHGDEQLRGLVLGRVGGRRLSRLLPARRWLIVATDQRLICLRQERFGRKEIDVPLGHVQGMTHRTRVFATQIVVETAQRKYRLRIPKGDAFRFIGVLSALMPRPQGLIAGAAAAARRGLVGALQSVAPEFGGVAPTDFVRREEYERLESAAERLEADMERLRQQVDFLENLLRTRSGGALPPSPGAAQQGALPPGSDRTARAEPVGAAG
jgi:hypothetical protein